MPAAAKTFPIDVIGRTEAVVMPFFTTNSVQVLREEEAYPIVSLVADVGGVLGLFIGFNFLMVWDWTVWGVKFIKKKN